MDVDVVLLEELVRNVECAGVGFQNRAGDADGFLHDIAKLSGQLQFALSGHGDGFDVQSRAAERRPGEAHGDADFRLLHEFVVRKARLAEILFKIVRSDDDLFIFRLNTFRDVHGRFAHDGLDGFLQGADACLTGVAVGDFADGGRRKGDVGFLQTMLGQEFGDEMAFRDLKFFIGDIARKRDEFHTVQ